MKRMKKNDLLTLTADGLGADLEGVCRADGMAVFVPGMLPGETARVRIVKVQPRFAFGRMEGKPLTASPARKAPDCAAYPRCGGCMGRHMTYETTLEAKRQQVQDCFRRIGHIDIDVPPVLGMADPSHYRNKTALPVGGTIENPVAGFFAPRSHDIIPIAQCPNAMPPADEICRRVLGWMKRFRVEPYVEETHTGLVRHIVIRVNRKGEAMAVLVINGSEIPNEGELVASLKAAGAVSVILNENRERTNVIMGRRFRTLYGCDTLTDELCDLRFEISPAAFFQVNPAQTEVLYQTARDFAELTGDELFLARLRAEAANSRGLRHPNLAVTRTFSKAFRMAGLRLGYLLADPPRLARVWGELMAFVAAQGLRPVVGATFSFDQMAEAHRLMESRRSVGKIVVRL